MQLPVCYFYYLPAHVTAGNIHYCIAQIRQAGTNIAESQKLFDPVFVYICIIYMCPPRVKVPCPD